MGKKIEIGNIVALPGKKHYGKIDVAMRADGTFINIPVAVANGKEDGPTVFAIAGSHGDEISAALVVNRLIRDIDPVSLKGALVGMPMMQMTGLMSGHSTAQGSRLSSIDYRNLNRAYPGVKDGEITEKVAYEVFQAVKAYADLVIDMHDGAWSNFFQPAAIAAKVANKAVTAKNYELVKAAGLPVVWITTEALPSSMVGTGAATSIFPENGIPAVALEVGGGTGFPQIHEESIQIRYNGSMNMMKYLGMIEGKVTYPPKQHYLVDAWWLSVKHSGIIHAKKEPIAHVKKGEVLVEVRDIFDNEVVDELRSPIDGLMTARRMYPFVEPGGWVAFVGREVSELP